MTLIKSLWKKITTSNKTTNSNDINQSVVKLSRDAHQVSRKKISKNALKVLYRLNEAGYQAFLVGGGVRDILLGYSPKDFDIATNATPEQIKQQFRNCRLIGRRFRLAHILFGREIIEVATFRGSHNTTNNSKNNNSKINNKARTSEQGMLVRDNVYGSLIEDAFRRDFTINALYYSVADFSVLDHVNGLEDLKKQQLRLIGEPVERYREDPVRILRAIRLACKLDLKIEKSTAKPIQELANMLEHVSPARLWDESHKLFLAGHAYKIWHELSNRQVLQHLFPSTYQTLNNQTLKNDDTNTFAHFIDEALKNTDKRIEQGLSVTPAFLFAVVLWQPMQDLKQKLIEKGSPAYEASQKAAAQILQQQSTSISIPKRFSLTIREIWDMQFRLFNRRKRSIDSLMKQARFRAGYDFLCLRAGNDAKLKELASWWTDFQQAEPAVQDKMIRNVVLPAKRKKKPNRKRYPDKRKTS